MFSTQKILLLLGLVLAVAGCATSDFSADRILRAATDTPDRFLVGSLTSEALTEPMPATGCRSPMVDPRDGTRLILKRSAADRGDYVVPAGRYGIAVGELLRLDCATGRPLGVVKE